MYTARHIIGPLSWLGGARSTWQLLTSPSLSVLVVSRHLWSDDG